MAKIKSILATEILDSRGNPTIETKIELADGSTGVASIPSGASTGSFEAIELRDNDMKRYKGMGVLKAVANVNEKIASLLIDKDSTNQEEIDSFLIKLDGTPNKSNLGANAILSVSQGVCEASAASLKIPNYLYINKLIEEFGFGKFTLSIPTPTFNVINGGKHGSGNLEFQEFHIIPGSSYSYSVNLESIVAVYEAVKQVLIRHQATHLIGDEGGYSPNLFTNTAALEVIIEAVKLSNKILGKDIYLGIDFASSVFYKNGYYLIKDRSLPMDANEFIEFLIDLQSRFQLIYLEDPLCEDDWKNWKKITKIFDKKVIIVGDDFLCTNLERLKKAIVNESANGILIKPNQVGTISETLKVIKTAREAGWKIFVSHRSGETNDDFIADFAVGVGADYTKFGAPARGERVVKYNRLLEIERLLNTE